MSCNSTDFRGVAEKVHLYDAFQGEEGSVDSMYLYRRRVSYVRIQYQARQDTSNSESSNPLNYMELLVGI